jgi:hypothetical protein
MVLQKLTTIALDDSLVQRIYKFKRDEGPDGQYLFNDIEFREGVGNLVSNDIWTGINNLQTFGVIGKFNPSYEKAIIYLSESDAKKILEACDDKTRNTLMRLAASLK